MLCYINRKLTHFASRRQSEVSRSSHWPKCRSRSFCVTFRRAWHFLILDVGDHGARDHVTFWTEYFFDWEQIFDDSAPLRELQFLSKTGVRFWSPNVLARVSVLKPVTVGVLLVSNKIYHNARTWKVWEEGAWILGSATEYLLSLSKSGNFRLRWNSLASCRPVLG